MYRRGQAPPGDFCLPRLTEEIQKAGAGGEKRKGIPRASYIQKDVENNGKLMVFMGTWYCIYIYKWWVFHIYISLLECVCYEIVFIFIDFPS